MIHRRAQLVTKLVLVGFAVRESFGTQMEVDQLEQARSAGANLAQIIEETLGHVAKGFFEQNLTKPDDVVDGRAQIVTHLGQRPLTTRAPRRTFGRLF